MALESLEAEDEDRRSVVDFNLLVGLNVVFADITVPSVVLVQLGILPEVLDAVLQRLCSLSFLEPRLLHDRVTVKAHQVLVEVLHWLLYHSLNQYCLEFKY